MKYGKTLTSTLFLAVAVVIALLSTTSSAQLLQPWKLTPIKAAPPVPAIPVTVTNTPLPVTVTNSVTVGNAVAISGPVTVGNPTTSPVPVRDVDNPANEPYLFYLCLSGGTLSSECTSDPISYFPTITASGKTVKRFVSEFVSGKCDAADDTHFINAGIRHATSFGGFSYGHTIPVVSMPSPPGYNDYAFAQEMHIFGNPGDGMAGGFAYWGAGNYFCSYVVEGYFVTQ